nr:MAG TPA: hypothetical protein [Caudoviricetes sp.]
MAFEGTLLDDDITADKLARWLEDASALHDSRVDEILGELDSFPVPYEEDDEAIPDVVYDYIDNLHGGINKLFDTIQLLVPTLADRAETFQGDAAEAQDALTVFREEVERDYIERTSLEDLYERLRDIREGYYGNDLSGAIEKLYRQVIDMMEGN